MESHIKVQLDLSQRITKAKLNFKKSPKERLCSASYISIRLGTLDELWSQFISTHTQLIQTSDTRELNATSYVKDNIYDSTEEMYINYKFELMEALRKLKVECPVSCSGENSDNKSLNSNFQLPKISISSFSGNYLEWNSFRDLFVSLVHSNKSLDDVQKLHYLKGLLVGEAEQLLRHVSITHANYEICWELLEKRYNNKRYLSNCILKRFMSQRNIGTESAVALKDLLDTTNECLNALKNLGIDTSTWDVIVICIVSQKLDNDSRKQWELKISELTEELPTLKQFCNFLETRFRALEFIVDNKISRSNVILKNSDATHNISNVYHTTTLTCSYCSDNHRLYNCKKFSKDSTDNRRDFVQSQGLCFNCLNSGHSFFACRQTSRCQICKRKHHSLLHSKNVSNPTDSTSIANQSDGHGVALSTATPSTSANELTNVTTCFSTSHCQVLLATALVNAQSKSGSNITLRCLVDPGSQASFITESAVHLLRLDKLPHKSLVSGLGNDQKSSLTSKSIVSLKLQSLHDLSFSFKVQAFVLTKLTSMLPERQLLLELPSDFMNINFADPSFNKPNKIDILLGADVYSQILLDGIIKGPPGTPMAQRTTLGWILSGPVSERAPKNVISMHVTHTNEEEFPQRFCELETVTPITESKVHFNCEEKKDKVIIAINTKENDQEKKENSNCKISYSKKITAFETYPSESEKVMKEFNINYLLTGCASIVKEQQIYKELWELLLKEIFVLHKWSRSSSKELLNIMSKKSKITERNILVKIDKVVKLLSLIHIQSWDKSAYVQWWWLSRLKIIVFKRLVKAYVIRFFDPGIN